MELKEDFPTTQTVDYLNAASIGLVPNPAAVGTSEMVKAVIAKLKESAS